MKWVNGQLPFGEIVFGEVCRPVAVLCSAVQKKILRTIKTFSKAHTGPRIAHRF
jgi:hypothetical protein